MENNYTVQIAKESGFPDAEFYVKIESEGADTSHRIHVPKLYHKELTGGAVSAKELVQISLAFLLEREPNTSIMSEFSLPVIERYFPAYKKEIQNKFIREQEPPHPPKSRSPIFKKLTEKLPNITFKDK